MVSVPLSFEPYISYPELIVSEFTIGEASSKIDFWEGSAFNVTSAPLAGTAPFCQLEAVDQLSLGPAPVQTEVRLWADQSGAEMTKAAAAIRTTFRRVIMSEAYRNWSAFGKRSFVLMQNA
jgi:hypothetical protein